MLSFLRGFLNTWPARIFFLLLASAFALWGIAGKNPFGADNGSAATVGGTRIEIGELQSAYKREAAQIAQMIGKPELPTEMRRLAATTAIDSAVTRAAIQNRVTQLGLTVPDAAVRDAAYAITAFHGPGGTFDRSRMEAVLRNNGLTEAAMLDLLRRDLGARQLLGTVHAVAQPPKLLLSRLFAYQHETRAVQLVAVPFAAAPAPPAPTEAQLRRWWENHPESFDTPEYRRIKAVVLSVETVAQLIPVSEDELRAAYDQRKAQFTKLERRSVQVLTAPDQATADRLALQWTTGSDWDAMQKAAQVVNASAVELPDAAREELPSPELAAVAFATSRDTVAPAVRGALGWYVVKVTQIEPGGTESFAEAREALRSQIVASKAGDLIDTNAGKVDDLLAGGTSIADLPTDFGLAPVEGSLDAQGNTLAGTPAPIPGSPALRAALVQAAFDAKMGDQPKLVQVPGPRTAPPALFALSLESVTAPARKPFDAAIDAVRADWTRDAMRHEADAAATAILTAVQGGRSLADAAGGRPALTPPPTGRDQPSQGVPAQLLAPLFGLSKGQATMVETPTGFVVAVLTDIITADPERDAFAAMQLRDQLTQMTSNDAQAVYAAAVRDQQHPRVQPGVVEALAQTGAPAAPP